jgi:capsular exopolysaccharide synthesis family protein
VIANAIASDLVKKNRDINIRVADDTIAFFDEQLRRYKDKLSSSDSDYLVSQTRDQLNDAIRRRSLIASERIRRAPTKSEIELANAEQELDRLLMDAKPSYPLVQELQKRVEHLRERMLEDRANATDETTSDADPASQAARADRDRQLRAVDAEIQELRRRLREVAKDESRAPLSAQELSSMQRDQQVNADIYRSLLLGLSNAQLKQKLETQGEQDRLLILDEARLPERPSKPNPFKILGLGLLAAIAAGLLGLFGREFFDSSFRGVKDARQSLGLPYLGFISLFPAQEKEAAQKSLQDGPLLWAQHHPLSVPAEQYRFLRTNLLNRKTDQKPLRSLLLTSTLENEGKTTTSVNLAASIAIDLEKRVVLVDLDLRHGSLSRLYNASGNPGAADVLEGRMTLDQVIQSTSTPRLSLVPRGVTNNHPGNVMNEEKVGPLLNALLERFDFVVVDGPRISELADAVILSNLVEATLFTVRTGKTRREQVEHALTALEATRRNAVIGYVLTHVASYGPSYVNPYVFKEA